MNESEIIQEIINGADRYEELVKRYHIGLIIHCEKLLKDRATAEDVAQEAFIKAYIDLKKYDPAKGRFSTWLYRIATNLAIDQLRKLKHRVDVEDVEDVAELTMPMHLEDEQKDEVRAAVAKLVPPEYRQVIEAYYWQGKSYQEIALKLNVPVNTVGTWMSRAKSQLKEQLL